jgi:HEPN domain-containing protein
MTEADVIAHWRKRARESLEVAKKAHEEGYFAHALFNCHLAVEKALKAAFMDEHRDEPPLTHNLLSVAQRLRHEWDEHERRDFEYLTQYAVAARYDDPAWAAREATATNSRRCITVSERFLSLLLP